MDTPEQPQLYLITPAEVDLDTFPQTLAAVLDAHPVACVRLALSTRDEATLARAADALREVTLARDVALVIAEHLMMVERLGLDGVHLLDGARTVRHARKELAAMIKTLAPSTDFFGIGDEIWQSEDPVAALGTLTAAMG